MKQRSQLLQQKNKKNKPTNIKVRDCSSPESLIGHFEIKAEYDTKFDVSDTSASVVLRTVDINGMEIKVYGVTGSLPVKSQKVGRRLTVKRSRYGSGKNKK